jgi:hypothetical protein
VLVHAKVRYWKAFYFPGFPFSGVARGVKSV